MPSWRNFQNMSRSTRSSAAVRANAATTSATTTTVVAFRICPRVARMLPQVVDRHGGDAVRRGKAEHCPVKIEFRLQAADDGFRLPETMLLTLEGEVGHRQPLGAYGVGHHLRLVGRHDF